MPLTNEERERILRDSTVHAWISKRAFELHELGGYQHGKAGEDWMVAESELLALASLFENIFRSKTAPRQPVRKRRDSKTAPKPTVRPTKARKDTATLLPSTDTVEADQNATEVEPSATKTRKPR